MPPSIPRPMQTTAAVAVPPHVTSTVAAPPARTNLVTSAGALLAAKVIFVIAGYAIYAALSRLLSPAQFGIFLVVNSTVAVLNAAFVSGTLQTVSRFVAQSPDQAIAGGNLRVALRLQAVLAAVLGGGYFLAAPVIAGMLGDPTLTPYLRVSAVIPVAYAFYAALIGYANGSRRFGEQAAFDVSFSVAKVGLVTALPWLGYGAFGAVAGFAAASVVILVLASARIGRAALRGAGGEATATGPMLRFELAVMAHVGVTNLLMQMDLLMVRALYVGADPSAAAAVYGTAAKLAQIPYSILVALNFVVLPYIARATSRAAAGETATYIRHALRLGAGLTVGPATVLAVVSTGAVTFVFGPNYASAGAALEILAFGYIAFSLWTMATTVINGSGRPTMSFYIAVGTVLTQIALGRLLIPILGTTGGAWASTGAYGAGLVAAMVYLTARFGAIIPWASLSRIAVAAVAVMGVSRTALGDLPVLVLAPLLGAVYVAAVVLLGEWRLNELRAAARGGREGGELLGGA
jgi:O-antigen/teichoic acid export membrane protein